MLYACDTRYLVPIYHPIHSISHSHLASKLILHCLDIMERGCLLLRSSSSSSSALLLFWPPVLSQTERMI